MRRLALGFVVAAAVSATPAAAQVAPPEPEPFISHVLPVAAGALVGTAVTFFILPLIVPALASGAPAVGPAVATPMTGAIGAALGGYVGYVMWK